MTEPPDSSSDVRPAARRTARWIVIAAVSSALAALALGALLTNIFERKQEARNPFYRVVELTDSTIDPAIWGKNFPQQYDDYRKTVDMVHTRYGGSEGTPRNPTAIDPRRVVAQSRLEEDPRLMRMWAGYAFARDFREERGHAYMLDDQVFTGRQQAAPQPGACLHCHASMYVAYKRAGAGDLIAGFERINPMPYAEAKVLAGNHPVACIDCHDPATMELRVTRPGFLEGIRTLKASQGVRAYDVNRDASRQEMRTYVCGQCHVEYYFKGKEKRLTYPWDRGLKVDSILSHYEASGHTDWIHERSGAPVLKAQHPEFEMYSQGVHARSGVACADCHMPYERRGALKISDHHVRSPLLNINQACQTCHKISEAELRDRVYLIQDRTFEMRNIAIDALLDLVTGIQRARAADSTAPVVAKAQRYQRAAQFFADFVEAENSMGFHADQEAVRILGNSINFSRLGQAVLRGERVPDAPLEGASGSAHQLPRAARPAEPIDRR
ncbi:MAG TPA: ammonia-forming cytochrome c nitrite reductase subunit c552 [Gemmatimonadales bacterium]|nr:ammonia-forming cytochrome c nitrite reductase subunit c552 [Gemmatimonadales bacterium]